MPVSHDIALLRLYYGYNTVYYGTAAICILSMYAAISIGTMTTMVPMFPLVRGAKGANGAKGTTGIN